ncbi:hypothetical protein FHR83_006933 [Actinoplanes campanulatus]|uniref:Fibronectin type-III domain-containing protein n=1 Tax=Actinoplanes campanulatus TaxID=113559 RepID=A0A7W5AMX1_9ACTN|nr:hypothetical protein [Actinoplanes campanulatus]MBB3099227.1 hypothetical protein [Actinoplanes campanulatus]GGN40906.1 hypothetical protein GCM10010109_70580 [Actinoplanes campanulatus]GID40545.1 hypothetical protein Aca09nite_70510 [Actinoplanes campanulatus]
MRHTRIAIALAATSLTLGGCAALGLGDRTATTEGAARDGESWLLVQQGQATPSPSVTMGAPSPTPEVSLSVPTPDPRCTKLWPRTDPALIPVRVTPGAGSLKVDWPTQFNSNYRVAAVPQKLVKGPQPQPVWQEVAPGSGCAMSTTVTGLTPGAAYIVWLDAPNTGHRLDGTRNLYSGRSGVVYPE